MATKIIHTQASSQSLEGGNLGCHVKVHQEADGTYVAEVRGHPITAKARTVQVAVVNAQKAFLDYAMNGFQLPSQGRGRAKGR